MATPTWFDTENQKYDVRPLLSYQGMKNELNSDNGSRHNPHALLLFWGLVAGNFPYDLDYLPDQNYAFVSRYWRGENIVIYEFRPWALSYTYIFIVGEDIPVIAGWYTNAPFDRVVNHFMESGYGLNPGTK